ncbi:trypsin-like peptidase domain-containing protein [Candidatus Woesearchaeota archaeon]|nr:trypsin-like peptidase domain-containing protein [Candidatus Woesearchaeota archaeon]
MAAQQPDEIKVPKYSIPNLQYVHYRSIVSMQLQNTVENLGFIFSPGQTPRKESAANLVLENLVEVNFNNSSGTGLLLTTDGWILTAAHCIRNELDIVKKYVESRNLSFLSNPEQELKKVGQNYFIRKRLEKKRTVYPLDIRYYAIDVEHDIALIKAVTRNGVQRVNSFDMYYEPIRTGDFVSIYGFSKDSPLMSRGRVMQASVSLVRIDSQNYFKDLFATNIYVEPGASGGPAIIDDRLAGVISTAKFNVDRAGKLVEIGHGKIAKIVYARDLVQEFLEYLQTVVSGNTSMQVPDVCYKMLL